MDDLPTEQYATKVEREKHPIHWVFVVFILALIGAIVFLYISISDLKKDLAEKEIEIETLATKAVVANDSIYALQQGFQTSLNERNILINEIRNSNDVVGDVMGRVSELNDVVDTLERLSGTDSELLQKYSKVFFLNEHYVPNDLDEISPSYAFDPNKEMKFHKELLPYLNSLMLAAQNAGIDLKIISAFRSFGEQSTLKQSYTETFGEGANQFSADQGFSEHQLGSTVDFTTVAGGTDLEAFEDSEAFRWLEDNAHKFGFALSYPPNNSYYVYEPWHWRFVGIELAGKLHKGNLYFYDLSQREIDAFLIHIFD